ncbi:MAG: aspartate aminotransferase family protein [Actinomycetes bacterium]
MSGSFTGAATDAETTGVEEALDAARSRYVDGRPRGHELDRAAREVMPGGNTRTVLYHPPFPLRVARAHDAVLEDVDGRQYVDLLGNYSAGLYGHSDPVIKAALEKAVRNGVGPGAHTPHEIAMARAVCDRFDSIERARFTNSGTEANLMALSAARAFTGRERILAFRGGYHGGLLTFAHGPEPVNAPYEVVLAPYNDVETATRLLEQYADSVAAVLVEPMLGSGGCIPGEPAFLRALADATRETGALLVLDEVMTSRTGRGGMQPRIGVTADLTTLGKYLGGGFSIGAFGGRADVMALFDPSQPGALPHAGTFNNNLASMTAGHAGLTQVYTPDVAERHTERGEALRTELAALLRDTDSRFGVTGVGTLMNLHATTSPVTRPEDLADADGRLKELLFLDLLEAGYYVAARGYLALSLAVTDDQIRGFLTALRAALTARPGLFTRP